jgi:hypothetical protein
VNHVCLRREKFETVLKVHLKLSRRKSCGYVWTYWPINTSNQRWKLVINKFYFLLHDFSPLNIFLIFFNLVHFVTCLTSNLHFNACLRTLFSALARLELLFYAVFFSCFWSWSKYIFILYFKYLLYHFIQCRVVKVTRHEILSLWNSRQHDLKFSYFLAA